MQRVIQDLESGDLAKEQLILEREIQSKLQEKLSIKDTIIHQYQNKEKNLHNELSVITEMMKLKDGQIQVAKDETKHFKRQRNLFGLGSGGIITLIILILI
tara:strand:- start:27 stop:329 length:303 start_codon:yes stop_codon:yes gene_type:complete